MLGLVGAASGYQLDHIKGVSIQRDSAQLGHHLGGDGTIAGEGRQFVDLIFQQKLVLAAAVQQGGFRALSKQSAAFVCPTACHLLQGGAAGFIELHAVAQLLTGRDQLLLPLAGAQLAELFLDDAGHDEDGVFGVGQRIAEVLQVLVRVGGRADEGHQHQPPPTEEGDGARCQHDLLHPGRGAVQHGGLGVILVQHLQRFLGGGVDEGLVGSVKVVQPAAGAEPFIQFVFTVKQRVLPP